MFPPDAREGSGSDLETPGQPFLLAFLKRRFAVFVVADSDGFVDAGDEDFAVADFAGAGGADDGGDGLFLERIGDDDFDFDLRQEIDGVFAAAVELGVSFLTAVPSRFQDGHAFNAGFEERVFDGVQLGGLEDGFDLLHKSQILALMVLAVADSSVSGWRRGMGIPRNAQRWHLRCGANRSAIGFRFEGRRRIWRLVSGLG